jgi:radical SAM protein with 4Fe4S-binding SPASM domain
MTSNFLRKLRPSFALYDVREFFRIPPCPGTRITPKRLLNLYVVRFQRMRAHTKLRGHPLVLTIEPANVCNLRCPYCFTGAGEASRPRIMFPLPMYRRLMHELGDYLFQVELHNWGEPLLNKDLPEFIRIATGRGIGTIISTNFSFPFDAGRAEALVSAGLSQLGVSIDGARQETYERYRVRGNLDLVLSNVRLMNQAKMTLGSTTPRLIWEFHVFEHNRGDIELAKEMARELRMDIDISKGWVAGPEWDPEGPFKFFEAPSADGCQFLWQRAVVNVDGSVAPCDGMFYKEDDFGSVSDRAFMAVWNNEDFQEARRLFKSRQGSERGRGLICYECPETLTREDYLRHLAEGGSRESFRTRFTSNDGFNYFFNRRPAKPHVPDAVDLPGPQPADASPTGPGAPPL